MYQHNFKFTHPLLILIFILFLETWWFKVRYWTPMLKVLGLGPTRSSANFFLYAFRIPHWLSQDFVNIRYMTSKMCSPTYQYRWVNFDKWLGHLSCIYGALMGVNMIHSSSECKLNIRVPNIIFFTLSLWIDGITTCWCSCICLVRQVWSERL